MGQREKAKGAGEREGRIKSSVGLQECDGVIVRKEAGSRRVREKERRDMQRDERLVREDGTENRMRRT